GAQSPNRVSGVPPQAVEPERTDVANGFPSLLQTAKVAKRFSSRGLWRQSAGDVRLDLLRQMELQFLVELRGGPSARRGPAERRDAPAKHVSPGKEPPSAWRILRIKRENCSQLLVSACRRRRPAAVIV